MSATNVEVLQGVYERWARGDFAAGVDLFDEHVLYVLNPEFPDAGAYLGIEAVAGYIRGLLEPWSRLTIEAGEFIEAGDSVAVAVRQSGAGTESGVTTEFRYFQVWTFRGDRVIRVEMIRERADALAAAGLLE